MGKLTVFKVSKESFGKIVRVYHGLVFYRNDSTGYYIKPGDNQTKEVIEKNYETEII